MIENINNGTNENDKRKIIVVSSMYLMKKLLALGYLDDFCGAKPNKYDENKSVFLFNYNDEINRITQEFKLERREIRNKRHEDYGD